MFNGEAFNTLLVLSSGLDEMERNGNNCYYILLGI